MSMTNKITCIECLYKFNCPAGRSYNNAACLTIRKSIMDIPEDEWNKKLDTLIDSLKNYLEDNK